MKKRFRFFVSSLSGFVTGLLVFLFAAAVVIPQYSDYRAAMTVSEWIRASEGLRKRIQDAEVKADGFIEKSSEIEQQRLILEARQEVGSARVNSAKEIIMQGVGDKGVLLVLRLEQTADGMAWKCQAGPKKAESYRCRKSISVEISNVQNEKK